MGISFVEAASLSLNTLNKWLEEQGLEKLSKILPEILPLFEPYMSSSFCPERTEIQKRDDDMEVDEKTQSVNNTEDEKIDKMKRKIIRDMLEFLGLF